MILAVFVVVAVLVEVEIVVAAAVLYDISIGSGICCYSMNWSGSSSCCCNISMKSGSCCHSRSTSSSSSCRRRRRRRCCRGSSSSRSRSSSSVHSIPEQFSVVISISTRNIIQWTTSSMPAHTHWLGFRLQALLVHTYQHT